MQPIYHRKQLLDSLKKFLSVGIKLDVAEAIRHHPHLQGHDGVKAYEELTREDNVEQLIRDLAPAAIIHLAGYRQNPVADG